MNRTVLVMLSTFLSMMGFPFSAAAQRLDIAGGYSFLRDVSSACTSECNIPGGWFGTLGVNVAPMFDVVADFSGGYKTVGGVSAKLHSYMFGPRVTWSQPTAPASVYGQVTFGGETASASAGTLSSSDNFFALGPGGGVNVKLNDQWGVRGGVNLRFVKPKGAGDWDKELQMIAGVVYSIK